MNIYATPFLFYQIGLVEKEWLDTLAAINPNEVIYTDFVESANTLAADLKDNQNCDIVIALTHMRQPNDIKLAENSPRVDLILGGHDHDVQNIKVSEFNVLKSCEISKTNNISQ